MTDEELLPPSRTATRRGRARIQRVPWGWILWIASHLLLFFFLERYAPQFEEWGIWAAAGSAFVLYVSYNLWRQRRRRQPHILRAAAQAREAAGNWSGAAELWQALCHPAAGVSGAWQRQAAAVVDRCQEQLRRARERLAAHVYGAGVRADAVVERLLAETALDLRQPPPIDALAALPSLPRLQRLTLALPADSEPCLPFVIGCGNLERLALTGAGLTDEFLQGLTAFLDVEDNPAQAGPRASGAPAAAGVGLEWDASPAGDRSAGPDTPWWQIHPLTELDLDGAALSDAGLRAVALYPRLTRLAFRGGRLGGDAPRAFTHHAALATLDLTGTALQPAAAHALAALRAARPACRIVGAA